MTQLTGTREPDFLRRIKTQRAPWDETDLAKRDVRLAAWFKKVASLPPDAIARALATHNRPHGDEILMKFLGAKYPSAPFGDITHIIKLDELEDEERPFGKNILFSSEQSGKPFRNTDWLTHWRDGLRLIGTGGSVLDEHAVRGEPRLENESGATLMARLLCVVDKEELRRLLNAVRQQDTKGGFKAILDGFNTKAAHREIDVQNVGLGTPEDQAHQLMVIRRGLIWLNNYSELELRIIDECRRKKHVWYVDDQKDIRICSIMSNLRVMTDYIREKYATAVNIQREPTNHTTILFDKSKIPSDVRDLVASAIREEEARIQNRPLPANRRDLTAEADVDCAPEWYYVHGNLLNGSESYPNTPATHIELWRIEDIVTEILAARANRIREWRKVQRVERQQQYKAKVQR